MKFIGKKKELETVILIPDTKRQILHASLYVWMLVFALSICVFESKSPQRFSSW